MCEPILILGRSQEPTNHRPVSAHVVRQLIVQDIQPERIAEKFRRRSHSPSRPRTQPPPRNELRHSPEPRPVPFRRRAQVMPSRFGFALGYPQKLLDYPIGFAIESARLAIKLTLRAFSNLGTPRLGTRYFSRFLD